MNHLIALAQSLDIGYIEYSPSAQQKRSVSSDLLNELGQAAYVVLYTHQGHLISPAMLPQESPEFLKELNRTLEGLDGIQPPGGSLVINAETGVMRSYATLSLPAGAAYTLNRLEELGATQAKLSYQGYGDAGNVFDVTLLDAQDSEVKEPVSYPHIESFFENYLSQRHRGWEENSGSEGFVLVNAADLVVFNEHTNYYEERELSIDKLLDADESDITALFETLKAELPPDVYLEINFYGSADQSDGINYNAYTYDEDGKTRSFDLDLTDAAFKALDNYAQDTLEDLLPGWCDNHGGEGAFLLSLEKQTVSLKSYALSEGYDVNETQEYVTKVYEYQPQRDGDLDGFIANQLEGDAPSAPSPSF